MGDVAERYLDAIVGHDWATLRECVTDDVVRVGPYGDTYDGSDAYVEFISSLMPTLPGYAMQVSEITAVGDRRFIELAETVEVDGRPAVTREVLVLQLSDDRIRRIEIYIQRTAP
jgi:ketosteroid isomerase-like protein